MTRENLIKFLETAVELEKRRHTLKNAILEIDKYGSSLGIPKHFDKLDKPEKDLLEDYGAFGIFGVLAILSLITYWASTCNGGSVHTSCVSSCTSSLFTLASVISFLASVGFLFYAVYVLITRKVDLAKETEKYSNDKRIMVAEQKADKERIDDEVNVILPRVEKLRKMLFEKYEDTTRLLLRLYESGVIYPKYCNIVAVCSFYEYVLSGRCDKLEGHEGAYNIFENEIRLNLIISKIEDVIVHLNKIEDNQYMLYNAISTANRQTMQLVENTKKLTASVDFAAEQTAIAAQNAKWAASEANTIKWLKIMGY